MLVEMMKGFDGSVVLFIELLTKIHHLNQQLKQRRNGAIFLVETEM